MPLAEIKQKYARRYAIYLTLLRAQGREDKGEPVLTQDDIEKMQKWLKALNELDRYIAAHKEGNGEVLRERQVPIFEDLRDYIEQGGKAGYVKLPTGVGKTVLFTELVEALDFKTLIVVPTTPLVEQTEERIEQFAPELEVGKIYGYAKEHSRQVTITTYDSLVAQVRDGKINPEDYDCLILDEAHTALSEKRSDTVRKFENTLKIGFTATPAYSENKKVENILPDKIHTMTVREAVEEGLLCSFSAMVARTEVDLSKVRLTSSGEYDEEQLAKAVNIASRNQSAVDLYKKTFSGETSVAYCVNIKHAESVARSFNEAGVVAEVISGNTSRAEQKRIKQEFHEGKIKVLCNADILIPGFDEPRASVCLNLRPTRSRVIAEQRGGRVLRTNRRDPNKHARIVDFIDRGIDEKRPPILFADVAEGAQFMPKGKRGTREGGGGVGKPPTPIIDIPGLEVVTDMEEVMRIVGKYREVPSQLEESKFLTFEILESQARAEGVTNQKHYISIYKEHLGWPSNPQQMYEGQWKGWNNFLGKEQLLFEELKNQTRSEGITSWEQYKRAYKKHPGWPPEPSQVYASQWPGMREFLGTEKIFFPLEQLSQEVQANGIKDKKDYDRVRPLHPKWPAAPDKIYPQQWLGWNKFLGTGFPSFVDLKMHVKLSDIRTNKEYTMLARELDWPAHPYEVYKDDWKGWDEFLGKEKKEPLPFLGLKRAVQKEKIRNHLHYLMSYRKHAGWPSTPSRMYADQWPGWDEFLGKKK